MTVGTSERTNSRVRVPLRRFRLYRAARVARAVVRVVPRYLALLARDRFSSRGTSQAQWDAVHELTAEQIRQIALALEGAFTKLAQIAGARADILPEPFIDKLSQFHDAVPPRSFASLRGILEHDLGQPIESVFARIDEEAIAAASLAQVHRATLHDGTDVAVKIQYPETRRLFPLDLATVRRVADLIHLIQPYVDLRAVVTEVTRFIALELDFRREADSTERLGKTLRAMDDVVVVPEVFRRFCGDNVIVLSFLDGIQVTRLDDLRRAGHDPAKIARRIGDLYGAMIFEYGFFHGDPHPGNLLVLPDARIGLLDFGLCKELPSGFAKNVAQMMIAAMIGDTKTAFEAADALGFDIGAMRAEHFRSLMLSMIGDSDNDDDVLDMLSETRVRRIPEDFALVVRTLILLNGLSHRLAPRRRLLQGALIQHLASAVAAKPAAGRPGTT